MKETNTEIKKNNSMLKNPFLRSIISEYIHHYHQTASVTSGLSCADSPYLRVIRVIIKISIQSIIHITKSSDSTQLGK
jgi:hypothetical protein